MTKTRALVLIPARMAATRLPGKPLVDIAGLPMIVQVLRRAQAAGIGEAVVATDSEVIQAAVEKSDGRAVMTRSDHLSGSDRIYEALEMIDPEHRIDLVVNVQGDLPTIEPGDIRAALTPLSDPAVDIATLEPGQALRERTDSCTVPAAGVVGEAMVAFVLAGAYRRKFGGDHIDDVQAALAAYHARIR